MEVNFSGNEWDPMDPRPSEEYLDEWDDDMEALEEVWDDIDEEAWDDIDEEDILAWWNTEGAINDGIINLYTLDLD